MSNRSPRHRFSSKLMLCAIALSVLGLVILCIYVVSEGSPLRRGSAGRLDQASPPPLLPR